MPGLGLPVEKINIRFQRCPTARLGRAIGKVPEFEVSQDLFDDAGVVDEAEYP